MPEADLYIVGHLLHSFDDKKAGFILKRVYQCLNKGQVTMFSLFHCLSICVCLSVGLSACLSVFLPVALSACRSVCLSVLIHMRVYVCSGCAIKNNQTSL